MKRKGSGSLEPFDASFKDPRVACSGCGTQLRGSDTVGCATCTGRFCAACIGAHRRPVDAAGHLCCAATCTDCPTCGQAYCNLHCAAGVAPCAVCGQVYCIACNHPARVDAQGHACCPTNSVWCRGCAHFFCNALCAAGHPRADDPAGHPLCPAVPHTRCPACLQDFCNAQCAGGHPSVVDVGGHPVCTGVLHAICAVCAGAVCDAQCRAVHTVATATCGHPACPATVTTCARCNETYCRGCKAANITVDVCGTCLAEAHRKVVSINVRHALIPGTGATLRRTLAAEGPIRARQVGEHGTPPPPLSTGETDKDAEIGDMKQYDRGHLIALELDGADSSYAIAPMIRQFNRAGTWRKMENTIVALLGGTPAVDVNDAAVSADTSSVRTAIDVSLRTVNTVDVNWHMEVYLFYHDARGDTRVPVWFYVRVSYRRQLWTHFSLANRCNEPAALPSRTESIEFQAATDIYGGLAAAKRDQVVSMTTRPMYTFAAPSPPNKILEFMDEVNAYCRANALQVVFTTMQEITKGPGTSYDDFQRPILRKYNRWKHAGVLTSDVPTDWLYEGERKDAYAVLSECGGRNAPEVDHVSPSYQGGGNLYINARLVSFYHNHLYREKKVLGSRAVNEELLDVYRQDVNPRPLAFMSNAAVRFDFLGINAFKLRYWTVTGEQIRAASFVNATLTIKSDAVVDGTTTAAAFFDAYFADDVLFDADRNLNDGVGNAYPPYRDPTLWGLVQARQTFLEAAAERERKYAAEVALLPEYRTSIDKHHAGLQAFIDDATHPERIRLLALIAAARDTGAQPLPLCKPSDVLLPGGGGAAGVAGGAYVDVRDGAASGDPHYADLMDRWRAVLATLT
jgi:hypothetical protein